MTFSPPGGEWGCQGSPPARCICCSSLLNTAPSSAIHARAWQIVFSFAAAAQEEPLPRTFVTGLPQFGAHPAPSISPGVNISTLVTPSWGCCGLTTAVGQGGSSATPIQGCLRPSGTAPASSAPQSHVHGKGSAAAGSPGIISWGTLQSCLEHQATLWLLFFFLHNRTLQAQESPALSHDSSFRNSFS